jgi:hypothetical protein
VRLCIEGVKKVSEEVKEKTGKRGGEEMDSWNWKRREESRPESKKKEMGRGG